VQRVLVYYVNMEMTDKQKKGLDEVGKKFDLKLILLYGSYAKGTQTELSDFDIAVLGKKPLDFDTHIAMYGEFSGIFGDIERELDVVVLERKDPLFLYQVAKNSQLLYGTTLEYNEFRAYAFRSYHDSKDLRQLQDKLMTRYQEHLNKTYAR
jgi:uncharacterized protein